MKMDHRCGDEVEIEMGMKSTGMEWRMMGWGLWKWIGDGEGVRAGMDDVEIEIRIGIDDVCGDGGERVGKQGCGLQEIPCISTEFLAALWNITN